MKLKIYRIDRSLLGKLNNILKSPDLPPQSAGAFIGNPFKNYKDNRTDNCYVLSKDDEIDRFTEATGNDWIDDIYYIRHPKKVKTDVLIPASEFHTYIIKEQIADLLDYVRGALQAKSVEINITRSKNGKIGLRGILDGIPLSGKASLKFQNEFSASVISERRIKQSEKQTTNIWIKDFPHIISAVDNAESSKITIKDSFDLSFGLTISAAEAFGIDTDWNSKYTFEFRVETF